MILDGDEGRRRIFIAVMINVIIYLLRITRNQSGL